MERYSERVPGVYTIINAMINENIINHKDDIQNDHIAFRTLGVEHLGIQSLEKIFLHFGYTKREHLNFESKNWMPIGTHLLSLLSLESLSVN